MVPLGMSVKMTVCVLIGHQLENNFSKTWQKIFRNLYMVCLISLISQTCFN